MRYYKIRQNVTVTEDVNNVNNTKYSPRWLWWLHQQKLQRAPKISKLSELPSIHVDPLFIKSVGCNVSLHCRNTKQKLCSAAEALYEFNVMILIKFEFVYNNIKAISARISTKPVEIVIPCILWYTIHTGFRYSSLCFSL